MPSPARRRAGLCAPALLFCLGTAAPLAAWAQDEAPPPYEKSPDEAAGAPNTTAGEFTPGRGFDLIKTDLGSLNISLYGLARYVNQLPSGQTYVDHLGRTQEVDSRNHVEWQRSFVWLSGFFFVPAFRYSLNVWSLGSTQQTLVFGNFRYRFGKALELGTGIGPNLGSRSMQGPWPFFLASDRQMADEFFRPGFTGSVWATGEPLGGLFYTVALGNNISELGVTAGNDTRDLSTSASVWWMPTTGEFGPRGGLGDLEHHEELATRFGVSATRTREDRYAQISQPTPLNTQIRLSDGLLLFQTGALADGLTLQRATYAEMAIDAGFKLRGFHLQSEYYLRWLGDFVADGPVPLEDIFDHGFFVQAMQMVIPKLLGVYATGSYVFDQFERHPWELAGGISVYPAGTRSWRLNLHVIYVDRSPTGSLFGYYVAGQTGPTVSLAVDLLL
jgi:hypothetical protein